MGHDHQDAHSHSEDADLIHEIKHEEMMRLGPLYDQHRLPLILRPFSSLLHKHAPVIVDTQNYQHQPLSNYSESQIVDRTVFALQKIQAFNSSFFNPQEHRILNTLPTGIVTYGLQFSFSAMNAIYLMQMWKYWSFNVRSVGVLGFFMVAQQVVLQVPNYLNETVIQWPRRRYLAKKYLDIYGAQFFHDLADPRTSLHKLEHLHNIA